MSKISKSTILLLILLAVCIASQPAEAETSIYVFSPDQSLVVKTGGFAGVHETYTVAGLFRLTFDPDAGIASFEIVDANLSDETGAEYGQNLDEIFNMTDLSGSVIDDIAIQFEGKTADGTENDVSLKLSLIDDSAHLTGNTTPPPNSADMFFYDIDAVATKKYAVGTGEPNDPYQIATAGDLMLLGETPDDYDKHFILTADIDLDPNLLGRKVFDRAIIAPDVNDTDFYYEFQGIPFSGVFNGNGHTISHLTIEGISNLGLFGQLQEQGEVSNVGLAAVNVNGIYGIGAILGDNLGGSIADSSSNGSVNGNWFVGGLVGNNSVGSIINCCSTGMVTGKGDIGGLVGHNGYPERSNAVLANCYSTAIASGGYRVGGLAGSNDKGSITTCFSAGAVTGIGDVGGLVGNNSVGSITNSYSTGNVSGDEVVGGLVGWNYNGSIAMSYSIGTVTGKWIVGGLVGYNAESSINISYSSSEVIGHGYIGGLIGCNEDSNITMSYSSGVVTGNEDVGGLVGYNWLSSSDVGSTTFSFWDMESSGQTTSAGGEGKTTSEMQTASTFLEAGWDFMDETNNGTVDIWWILEGQDYPRLWWETHD
ncbi:MAG TPA: hypothetical protein DIU00_19465 [Phycisphaerales bacterium]|nr:hypothetical protein [Phycisphaerales bacterium]